jgi:hypothetical protein
MNLARLVLSALAAPIHIVESKHLPSYTPLPAVKTGPRKYRGPGRRLPKILVGYRTAMRRQERFIKAHHTLPVPDYVPPIN